MNRTQLAEHLLDAIDNPPNQKEDIAAPFKIELHQDLISKIKANAAAISDREYKQLYENW